MEPMSCAVLVLGGGPGGYVCAIRAGQLGLDTVSGGIRSAGRHLPERRLHSIESADSRRQSV